MPLINYQINLILTSSANCVIPNAAANQAATFSITDTKLYVPIGILSAQDNAKLLQQVKSGFKRTITWNKYQKKKKKPPQNAPNEYLDYVFGPSFPVVNKPFVLKFNAYANRIGHSRDYFPT